MAFNGEHRRTFRLYLRPDLDASQMAFVHRQTTLERAGKPVIEDYPWHPKGIFEPVNVIVRGSNTVRTCYRLLGVSFRDSKPILKLTQ